MSIATMDLLHPGSLETRRMTGTRLKVACPPARVKELASQGYSKREIARKLGMCFTTFRANLVNSVEVAMAWKAGAREAGTFNEGQVPRTLWADDEGVVNLREGDTEIVLAALKVRKKNGINYPKSKRIRHLREITLWTTSDLIASLERLVVHLEAVRIEGLDYTEFAAAEKTKATGEAS